MKGCIRICLFCLVLVLISSRTLLVPAAADEAANKVWNGVWFTCEFASRMAPPEDGCQMFDDEGFEVIDGDFFYLRNKQSDELACRGGKKGQCFAASLPSISVSRRPIGRIEIAEDRLWLRWMGCRQMFHIEEKQGFYAVIPDEKRCYWAKKRHFYVARYQGQTELANQ